MMYWVHAATLMPVCELKRRVKVKLCSRVLGLLV